MQCMHAHVYRTIIKNNYGIYCSWLQGLVMLKISKAKLQSKLNIISYIIIVFFIHTHNILGCQSKITTFNNYAHAFISCYVSCIFSIICLKVRQSK